MSTLIASRINAVRRKHASVRAGEGLCTMEIVFISTLLIEMGIDWVFDLPYWFRAAVLAVHATVLLYLLAMRVIGPLVRAPDDETVALWIESSFPEAASRIISAVQFARVDAAEVGASALMMTAVVREAEEFIEPRDTGEAVSADNMLKRVGIAGLLALLGIGLFIWGRPGSQDLLLRAFAVPGVQVPRKTHVELITANPLVIAKGDSVTIAARASGVIPGEGTLRVQYANGATADFAMKPDEKDRSVFAVSIDNAQDGFAYRVKLNDGQSDRARVEAHDRPSVAALSIEQIYPAYTRLKPAKMSNNDLTVLGGSRLAIRVTANEPLKATLAGDHVFNRVTFSGVDQSFELRPEADDPKTLVAYDNGQPGVRIPPAATGLAIHLVDTLGLESKDDAAHPLQVIPDAPPTVKITYPTSPDELVTEKAKTPIAFDITDDFGLASASIKYRPAGPLTNVTGDGLTATYYKGDALEGTPLLTRVEPMVNLDYNRIPVPGVPREHFTVRWTGKIVPPATGTYKIAIKSDDGIRVWLDGQQVLDAWGPRNDMSRIDSLQFEAGKPVDLRLEYLQLEGAAECKMIWIRPGNVYESIPQKSLFSSDDAIAAARDKQSKSIELQLGDTGPGAPPIPALRGQYPWDLAPMHLSPGDAIEWWIEAADANDQTGPGRTQSEHRLLHIGTEAQVREALLGKLGDYLQQIQDVQDGQKDITSKLGQIILEKPGTESGGERQK